MDLIVIVKALILGVVEGLTEFLPVSSTGHLIVVGSLLNWNDEKGEVFEIVIQTGAMLAIVWEYRARFAAVLAGAFSDPKAQRFIVNLMVAFLPAAVRDGCFHVVLAADAADSHRIAAEDVSGVQIKSNGRGAAKEGHASAVAAAQGSKPSEG